MQRLQSIREEIANKTTSLLATAHPPQRKIPTKQTLHRYLLLTFKDFLYFDEII